MGWKQSHRLPPITTVAGLLIAPRWDGNGDELAENPHASWLLIAPQWDGNPVELVVEITIAKTFNRTTVGWKLDAEG